MFTTNGSILLDGKSGSKRRDGTTNSKHTPYDWYWRRVAIEMKTNSREGGGSGWALAVLPLWFLDHDGTDRLGLTLVSCPDFKCKYYYYYYYYDWTESVKVSSWSSWIQWKMGSRLVIICKSKQLLKFVSKFHSIDYRPTLFRATHHPWRWKDDNFLVSLVERIGFRSKHVGDFTRFIIIQRFLHHSSSSLIFPCFGAKKKPCCKVMIGPANKKTWMVMIMAVYQY